MSGPTHFSRLTYPGDASDQVRLAAWEREVAAYYRLDAWGRMKPRAEEARRIGALERQVDALTKRLDDLFGEASA